MSNNPLPKPLTSTQMFTRLTELEKENAELVVFARRLLATRRQWQRVCEDLQWRVKRLEAALDGR